jgi:hypothetical protein
MRFLLSGVHEVLGPLVPAAHLGDLAKARDLVSTHHAKER